MKKYRDKFLFNFRYAIKNIIFGKLKSIAIFITFILIFIIVFAIFSLKNVINKYYINQVEQKYANFNLVMKVDENTNARFFSTRHILSEGINDKASFLEINTLMEYNKLIYIKVMAGGVESLKKLSKEVQTYTIHANEVIITKSLALDYGLNIEDEILLQFDSNQKFKIIEIVEDAGLFTKNTIFIDKDSNLKYILNSLNLGSINPEITKNLFNLVYLDVQDIAIKDELKSIPEYQHLSIEASYSEALITQNIEKTISSFLVIFIFVLLAILFVLQTTLAIIFKGRIKEIGIIKGSGGRSSNFLGMILFEIGIYFILSLIFGVLLINILINFGYSLISSNLHFYLNFKTIIFGILIVLILIFSTTLFNYNRIRKTSIILLSQDNKVIVKDKFSLVYLGIFSLLLITNLLFNQDKELQALISSLIYIILGFVICRIILKIGKLSRKKNFFKIVSLKNVNQNKNIFHNLNILIISFFSIVLMSNSIRYHQDNEELIKKSLMADFLITNIVTDVDEIADEVELMDDVQSVDAAYIFQNIPIVNTKIVIPYILSVPNDKILDYFALGISNEVIDKINDQDSAYIILSDKYRLLYDYKIDDPILLNINELYPNEEFIIAGFFNDRNSLIAITNMVDTNLYQDISKNALLVNSIANKELLQQELITKYKSKLFYILDFDLFLLEYIYEFNFALKYLTYMAYIIIACFAYTIFNNSILIFEELKQTYSKLRVLGITNARLIFEAIKENIYTLISVLISVVFMVIGVIPNLQNIVLYFDVYFPFSLNFSDLLVSLLICIIVYSVSYIYYFSRFHKLKLF